MPRPLPPPPEKQRVRGRPPVISNERLLSVAREVFLELGIRATTLEVAARAGIAEGTIFHRFKSKEDLFRAAMQFDPDDVLVLLERLPKLAGRGELRSTLVEFAGELLRLGRVAVPVMMMSWSNPDNETCGQRGERYRRVLSAITAFFAAEMRAGRLAKRSPEVLARMLLGSLHQYCMSELFAPEAVGVAAPQFATEVVNVLLAAASPHSPAREQRPQRAAKTVRKPRELAR